jgi:Cysteine-rich secretory protein family
MLGLLTALIASVLPIGVRSAHAALDERAAEFEFYNLLNGTRTTFGKTTLQRDPGLDRLALDWAGKMADVYDITHTVLDTVDRTNCTKSALCHRPNLANALSPIEPAWLGGGENVGTGGAVGPLHDAFVASPGHFANIIGNYNRVGVGVVVRNDRIWVTFNFLLGPALSSPTPPPVSVTQANATIEAPRGLPVVPIGGAGYFRPIAPIRVLDTRSGVRGLGPVADHSVFTLSLADEASRPGDAFGAALNITAVGPAEAGYLTVFPCGSAPPDASNINFAAGGAVPNLVTVAFGANSTICVYTSTKLHLLADLAGWLGSAPGNGASTMTTVEPIRVLDSRSTQTRASVFTLSLAGRVPVDATAASLNLTVTDPDGDGFLTAYPCGTATPSASNVNFRRGQTIPNLATVAFGPGQTVCLFANKATHLIIDLAGYFAPAGGLLNSVVPDRVIDTRQSLGGWTGRLGAGQTIDVKISDLPGMPANVSGVLINLTAVDPSEGGYVTIYPCGTSVPTASNLNFAAHETVANLTAVHMPANGSICLFSSTRVHIIADLQALITPIAA